MLEGAQDRLAGSSRPEPSGRSNGALAATAWSVSSSITFTASVADAKDRPEELVAPTGTPGHPGRGAWSVDSVCPRPRSGLSRSPGKDRRPSTACDPVLPRSLPDRGRSDHSGAVRRDRPRLDRSVGRAVRAAGSRAGPGVTRQRQLPAHGAAWSLQPTSRCRRRRPISAGRATSRSARLRQPQRVRGIPAATISRDADGDRAGRDQAESI